MILTGVTLDNGAYVHADEMQGIETFKELKENT